ncbi:hypothetical protein ETAA8_14660 [Anatilimnocola aggregata]|uniref:Uncharacterized protein n=1 Tax=Anatilimnocola aggregata TaxID=2528021 RepID=A0A517Y822_9BACT|nr:hypothetical protein [Anatilimnocola aggregata]QDU26388.1 hypothetical protein ETAA8_14660 [Anatilimnocola aggregata]
MTIEEEYNTLIYSLTPRERIARSAAMFQWMREMIGRQICQEQAEFGSKELTAEELKWRIALRVYAAEPAVVALIQRRLADVSG